MMMISAARLLLTMTEVLMAGDDDIPPENPSAGEKPDGQGMPVVGIGSEDKTPSRFEEKENSVAPATPLKGTIKEKPLCSDDLPHEAFQRRMDKISEFLAPLPPNATRSELEKLFAPIFGTWPACPWISLA